MNTATAANALYPILKAGALSRRRLIQAVCPNDHRLVDVIETPDGSVIMYRPSSGEEFGDVDGVGIVNVGDIHVVRSGRHWHLIDWFHPYGRIAAWCRCGPHEIDLRWLAHQMTGDRSQRVIVPVG